MRLKDFNNYKIVNINGQVVKKKSPWPKILVGALVTALIIFIFMKVTPNFNGHETFTKLIKNFFNFGDIRIGSYATLTIGDTFINSLKLLWNTILFSLLGTIIGIFVSIPLAFLSSKNIMKKWYIYTPFRVLMSLVRSIPPLIVAFLMFNVFTPTLSGTIALSIFVTSIMTKWLFEELDSIDLQAFSSLQALGNQKNRSIVKAVMPYLFKSIISYGVYAFEMVIRFAAILGVVGIVTIGALLKDIYAPPNKWGHMSIVLMVLIVTIITIEILTLIFKKYVLNRKIKQVDIDKSKNTKYKIAQVKYKRPKTWILNAILGAALITLIVLAIQTVEWSIASETKLSFFKRGLKDLFHPDWSYINHLGTGENAIELGGEAILVAIASAIIGLFLSFILGIMGSKAFMGKYFSWFFRVIIIAIRSVPAFVYAMIFVFLSPMNHFIFAGVLALGIHSIGMLGKLTYEKLDSIDLASRKALEVMGSSRIISTRWALIKEAMPTILSNAIYRIEINFKSTVEIGVVGASAFGQQIGIYSSDPNNFDRLTPYLLVTMAIVLTLEQISNALRRKIMTGHFVSKNNFALRFLRNQSTLSALAYAQAFDLEFKRNQEFIKFNNYVGRRMNRLKENKAKYKVIKTTINSEVKSSSLDKVINKYS